MNVKIASYIMFEGHVEELHPLLDDIADALVKHGFGNDEEDDSIIKSLVVLSESDIGNKMTADEFAKMTVQSAYTVLIPVKEEQ